MSEIAFLDQEAAARYLGVSTRTLENMRMRGQGPPFCKVGRRVTYSRAALDAYMATCTVRSTGEAKRL